MSCVLLFLMKIGVAVSVALLGASSRPFISLRVRGYKEGN
jgi:hypothetical protein